MSSEFELRLRKAFPPIDPPADLDSRLEDRLGSIVDMAAEELEAWELRAMRDPRNWVRPVAAAAIGSGAAVGLVLIRTRSKRAGRLRDSASTLDLASKTLRDLAREVKRVVKDAR